LASLVVTPLINYVSGFVQRSEPMGIQALFYSKTGRKDCAN